jgi:hypothetical protein
MAIRGIQTNQNRRKIKMEDQYYDIERRTAIKEEARMFRRRFLTYEQAELIYSMSHRNRENAENLSMQEKQEIEYILQKDRKEQPDV